MLKIGLFALIAALAVANVVGPSVAAQSAPPTVPETRFEASAVWDDADGVMLLFGGCCAHGGMNDLWAYRPNDNNWSQLSPNGPLPAPRSSASAVWDATDGQMLVFGGSGADNVYFNDLWSYRPNSNTWTQLAAAAPLTPREGASAVWDSPNQQMLLFGGRTPDAGGDAGDIHTRTLSDFWSYQPQSAAWSQLEAPGIELLAGSPAVWDDAQSQLLTYGGFPDELWSYQPNGAGWSHLVPPVSVRYDLSAFPGTQSAGAWDSADGQMLLFGGGQVLESSNALWTYRPVDNTWTKIAADEPLPQERRNAVAVWDSSDKQLLVFGGHAGLFSEVQYFDDVWSYRPDANAWTQLHPGGPDNGVPISLFRPLPTLRIPAIVPLPTSTPAPIPAAPTATPTPVSVSPSPTPTLTAQQAIHQINDGPHGSVPAPAQTGACSGSSATVKIENQTGDSLVLYLAGPSSQTVTIAPKDNTTLRVPAGTYDIGARVSDPSVRPFSGSWALSNCAWGSRFYIKTV